MWNTCAGRGERDDVWFLGLLVPDPECVHGVCLVFSPLSCRAGSRIVFDDSIAAHRVVHCRSAYARLRAEHLTLTLPTHESFMSIITIIIVLVGFGAGCVTTILRGVKNYPSHRRMHDRRKREGKRAEGVRDKTTARSAKKQRAKDV